MAISLALIQNLWTSLLSLGGRRLAALAIVGVSVVAATILSGFYLSRPTTEVLYSALDRNDVVSIGAALKEAGISFDVTADDTTVLVQPGQTAVARMILAEKGLPHSGNAGNELFDKLGSLGLTSFMQDVTRVRAIEGELGRTIQMMRNVKAARVHIVMSDEGSFRRERQPPSASVIVRSNSADDRALGDAIRHLVSASIPNMKMKDVTVIDVEGHLLAAGSDALEGSPENLIALEKKVTSEIRERINKILAPYVSLRNFQISVAARLNADQKKTNETTFDPESRAERSVRLTKERVTSQNAAGQRPVGADANLPKPAAAAGETKQSNDDTQKSEQLTNYELSSKSVLTTSASFAISELSVAMLINRSALAAAMGEKASPEAIEKQGKEIERLVSSAAGLRAERGDTITLSIVDFLDSGHELEPIAGPSVTEVLLRQSGSIFNALAVLLAVSMLIWFGLRPATKMLLAQAPVKVTEMAALADDSAMLAIASQDAASNAERGLLIEKKDEHDEFADALLARKDKSPQRQLQRLVELDEEHAVAILRQWIRQGASA